MLRYCFLLLSLVAFSTAGGCRSCSTCHDYGPPVANCQCHACGTHRAGSASDEVIHPELAEEQAYMPEPAGEYEADDEMLPPNSFGGPEMEQPEGAR